MMGLVITAVFGKTIFCQNIIANSFTFFINVFALSRKLNSAS